MKKSPEMMQTTVRVTKRTARYLDYLKAALKANTGRHYTTDDVLWEALSRTFRDEIRQADEVWAGEQQDENN